MKSKFWARHFGKILCIGLLFSLTACAGAPSAAAPTYTTISDDSGELDAVIRAASDYLNERLPGGIKLVFLNFQSEWPGLSEYVIDGLIENTVNDGRFTAVDRKNIALIQQEMNFQLSGEVSDESAQAIGKLLGAQTIVSGAISRLGNYYRLRVQAIGVETAEIQGQFNRDITGSLRIIDLTQSRTSGVSAVNRMPVVSARQNAGESQVDSSVVIQNVPQINYEQFVEIRTLESSNTGSGIIAMTPDGKNIVSNTNTGLKIWDIETGEVIKVLEKHFPGFSAIAFSPDGKRFITDNGKAIRITDFQTGAYRECSGHSGHIRSLAYNPRGSNFVSGSSSGIGYSDNTIKIWDAETGQETLTLAGHAGSVRSVIYNHDGSQIISCSDDGTIRIWDARDGTVIKTISVPKSGPSPVSLAVPSPDTQRIAAATGNKIIIYNAQTGQELFKLTGHEGKVSDAAFTSDGSSLISADSGLGNTIRIWNLSNGGETGRLRGGSDIKSIQISPDGKYFAVGASAKSITIWGLK
jgi:WD40 repeat protein